MKRIFAGLALLVIVVAAFGYDMSRQVTDGEYVYEQETLVGKKLVTKFDAAAADTISGDDSIIIVENWVPDPGWQYILVTAALTEGTEAEFCIAISAYDEDGDYLYQVTAVDTLADGGGACVLPIGETVVGSKYKVFLYDGAADEGTNVLNTTKLYKRRAVQGNQVRWR